jgi:hypothetical protein
METILGESRKFLASVCAFLFVVTSAFTLVLYNAEMRLFDASLYINAMQQRDLYNRLPALAAETIAASPEKEGSSSPRAFLRLLPYEDWETIFQALLPPDVIQPMIEQGFTSIFDYLDGKSETVSLSLVGFKSNLEGPAGTETLLAVLRKQPACSLEQIAQLTINSLFGQASGFILCNPSNQVLSLFQPLIQFQLKAISAAIPDTIDLTPDVPGTKHPLDGLREARLVMRFSPLIPLGLLFLVTLLVVRSLTSWSSWWGIPILLGGSLGLLFSALIHPLAGWAIQLFLLPRLPDFLPASVPGTIQELLMAVLSGVTNPILIQSGVLTFLGILILLVQRIFKRPR